MEPIVTGTLDRRDRYPRYACLLMIAAIGLRAAFAILFESPPPRPYWAFEWCTGYLIFVAAYLAASMRYAETSRVRLLMLATQSASALFLVWLYPSFIVTCLLVVVAWQIGWLAPLRTALVAALAQSVVLALLKCVGETADLPVLILVITGGFQVFAITAAHLARGEAQARDELMRLNGELRSTQALMAESARMAERLRISRDLHDILGHNLAILTIHLEVASRLAQGQAAQHVQCARDVASELLSEVRAVVNQVRVQPVDLRAALQALTDGAVGLQVRLTLPDQLAALDPARADAIIRCVQEVLTNTLRHARAKALAIELKQTDDGCVSLIARDDGVGGTFVEGRGLTGMRERFRVLGGELSIASLPGEGFTVRGAIPRGGGMP